MQGMTNMLLSGLTVFLMTTETGCGVSEEIRRLLFRLEKWVVFKAGSADICNQSPDRASCKLGGLKDCPPFSAYSIA